MGFATRFFTPIVLRVLAQMPENTLKRVHRLEIELLELTTEFASLRDSHMKLLKRTTGGGRPPGRPSQPAPQELDAIPKGDKAALRQHFAAEIASRSKRNN